MLNSRMMVVTGVLTLLGAATASACGDRACGQDGPTKARTPSTETVSPSIATLPLPDLFADYLSIQRALAADSVENVETLAAEIATKTGGLIEAGNEESTAFSAVSEAALRLKVAGDLAASRIAFGGLSDAMIAIISASGDAELSVAYCPMAQKSWLQKDGPIANPYFGSAMLRCGSFLR